MKYCLYIMLFTSLLACTKLRDTYSQFVGTGEIYYPGKADSLTAYPGRNRIQLTWLLVSDPKIVRSTVYWNNRADSVAITVAKTGGIDTIKTILNNMTEGTYTFEVFTYDNKGNRSVKVERIANVYGYNYDISLVNRPLKSVAMNAAADTALLDWYPASGQHIAVDLRYKNQLNDSVFVTIPPDSIKVKLPKFKKGESFKYRSMYKPEKNAIDTFYTVYESKLIP
jgi:hypothetical protein